MLFGIGWFVAGEVGPWRTLYVRTGFGYIVGMEMYSFPILALRICQVWIFGLQFAGDKFLTPSLSDEWFEFAYQGYALMPNAHASCMASNLVCYTVVAPLPVFCQTLLNFTLFGPGWYDGGVLRRQLAINLQTLRTCFRTGSEVIWHSTVHASSHLNVLSG